MRYNVKKILSIILIIAMLSFTAASFTGGADQVTDTDKDGDGWNEAQELEHGTNSSNPDTDDDGIIDSEDDEPLEKAKKIEEYDEDEWDRKQAQDNMLNSFLFVMLLSFAIFSLIAGIFTAYFGAGKSRGIGGVLLLLGLVIILFWVYYGQIQEFPNDTLLGIIHWEAAKTLETFLTVIGALIGAVIAVVLFLVAIMKS